MNLRVGQMLYGYCRGIFGRDSYGDKRIEAIGYDWVVVRDVSGIPDFAYGLDTLETLQMDDCTKPTEVENEN